MTSSSTLVESEGQVVDITVQRGPGASTSADEAVRLAFLGNNLHGTDYDVAIGGVATFEPNSNTADMIILLVKTRSPFPSVRSMMEIPKVMNPSLFR